MKNEGEALAPRQASQRFPDRPLALASFEPLPGILLRVGERSDGSGIGRQTEAGSLPLSCAPISQLVQLLRAELEPSVRFRGIIRVGRRSRTCEAPAIR